MQIMQMNCYIVLHENTVLEYLIIVGFHKTIAETRTVEPDCQKTGPPSSKKKAV